MAQDGRIYITISDKQGGGEKKATEKKKEKEKSILDDALFNQTMHFARQQAIQFANYAVNNIGNFTGDFNAQASAQQAMSAATQIMNVGIAFAVNPVAGALSLAATGVNLAYQEYSRYFENKKTNYQISQLRDISGLNTLTNGSR